MHEWRFGFDSFTTKGVKINDVDASRLPVAGEISQFFRDFLAFLHGSFSRLRDGLVSAARAPLQAKRR